MRWQISPKAKFGVSLFFGLLTTGVFWFQQQKIEQKATAQETLTTVLKAKRYIKLGRVIKPHLVEEVRIPQAYLEPTALTTKQTLLNSKDQPHYKARLGLLPGEQLTQSKLWGEDVNLGMAWLLKSGQVAITLKLRAEQAVGGWIEPGDWVHIFSSLDPQPGWSEAKTHLLLDRVQVLGVGDQCWDPTRGLGGRKKRKMMEFENFLVTLGVSAYQAGLLTHANRKGDLTLVLVPFVDERVNENIKVGINSLK